jgi:hypothetical protein
MHNTSLMKKSYSNFSSVLGGDSPLKRSSVGRGSLLRQDTAGVNTSLGQHKVKVIARFRPLSKMELVACLLKVGNDEVWYWYRLLPIEW